MDIKDLNNEQKLAVTTTEGYVRVIAGPGSGKTRALTYRYAYLVEKLGISPRNILCVTFTNKAASEMKKRIRSMTKEQGCGFICTFHSFCANFLRTENKYIQFPNHSFMILDTEDQKKLIKRVYKNYNIDAKKIIFKDALEIIGKYKHHSDYIQKYIANSSDTISKKISRASMENKLILGYIYEQKKIYALDFNDLILFTLHILTENKKILEKWSNQFQYIMVDEFQDINQSQFALLSLLSENNKNLFVVGDPDQTIYSWRGSDFHFLLDFDKVYKTTKTIYMTKNYRSVKTIVDVANSLIENNTERLEKKILATKKEFGSVLANHFTSEDEEAKWISKEILSLHNKKNINFSDVALLYRTHTASRKIEENLIKNKIPYILYNGVSFYNRKEIKDIISYLRLVLIQDDLSFERVINVPTRGVGNKRIEFLQNYANEKNISLYHALKENINVPLFSDIRIQDFVYSIEFYIKKYKKISVSELVETILRDSKYEQMLREQGDNERLDNIAEFKQSIKEYEDSEKDQASLEDYLEKIALYSNSDQDDKKNKVKLMTIHTAKGLEFPYVFLCRFNEGIFPTSMAYTKEEIEEERRCAYVAITRAEQGLYITESEGMNYDFSFRYPSRFLLDIKSGLIEFITKIPHQFKTKIKKISEKTIPDGISKPKKIYDPHTEVLHPVYGSGEIIDVDKEHCEYIIKFEKVTTCRNISFDFSDLKQTTKRK